MDRTSTPNPRGASAMALIRQAHPGDVEAMHRVRLAVRENRLVSLSLSESDYLAAIESGGRGWVAESDGEVVGDARSGSIWALFVHPEHERRGLGRRLHDAMVEWLWWAGLERLRPTTAPGTRAQGFSEAAGWRAVGRTEGGEERYELTRPGLRVASAGTGSPWSGSDEL